jgi:hypothetical protein
LDSIFLSFTIAFKSTFGSALRASSLVILPPLPEPLTEDGGIFFSVKILEAAGDGDPVAKLFSEIISLDSSIDLITSTGLTSFCYTYFRSFSICIN